MFVVEAPYKNNSNALKVVFHSITGKHAIWSSIERDSQMRQEQRASGGNALRNHSIVFIALW